MELNIKSIEEAVKRISEQPIVCPERPNIFMTKHGWRELRKQGLCHFKDKEMATAFRRNYLIKKDGYILGFHADFYLEVPIS
jgi:hypothetical protein